jgi:tight adherence protein B
MNFITILAAVSVVVVVLLLGQAIFWAVKAWQESRDQEVTRRLGITAATEKESLLRLQGLDRGNDESSIEIMLKRAGSPYPMSTLQGWMGISAIVGLMFGLIILKGIVGVVGLVGAFVPLVILRFQANARMGKLVEQLPDALDLLSRSLQAGHGVGEAMRMAAEEIPAPMGLEFERIYEENNLGRDLRECLQNMVKRNPGSFDLQIFVSSVLLQRDTGGNLVEILQNISSTVRARFLFQGKLAALTSEAKFTGWVLGSLPIFVATVISLRNPAYLAPLWTDPLGIMLLIGCLSMYSFGVFLMSDFSKVEV